ncbi:MAG: hypothetical protein ACHQX1_01710 [Candidatus Micrarchaeales archaeon]
MAETKPKKKGFGIFIWILIALGVLAVIVLIVAFALGLFFSLGVFGPGYQPNSSNCIPSSGFLCDTIIMNTYSNVSFGIGNYAGNLYNMQFACASKQTASGGPPAYAIFNGSTPTLNMKNGTYVGITELQCYGDNGKWGNSASGTTFSGFIWINYTDSAAPQSSTNPWHTIKYATFSVKVT